MHPLTPQTRLFVGAKRAKTAFTKRRIRKRTSKITHGERKKKRECWKHNHGPWWMGCALRRTKRKNREK